MRISPLPDIPLRQFMPFNPVWVAGIGDILHASQENYFNHIELIGNDVFSNPGIVVGTVYSVQVSPGVLMWRIHGLNEQFATKVDAMIFLQGLEHEREEREMKRHYTEYMRRYHVVLGQALARQAMTYQPAIS